MKSAARMLVLLAASAAACGPGAAVTPDGTAPPPTVEVTAAPTPAPTPTPEPTVDVAAVGAAYLAFAEGFNAAQAAANAAIDAATNDDEAIAAYQLFVDAFDSGVTAISAIEFPPELEDEAADLVAGYTKVGNAFRQLVADPNDPDPFIDTNIDEGAAEIATAATAIRAALGLPPPPTIAP